MLENDERGVEQFWFEQSSSKAINPKPKNIKAFIFENARKHHAMQIAKVVEMGRSNQDFCV
jgi:hypothetical protein